MCFKMVFYHKSLIYKQNYKSGICPINSYKSIAYQHIDKNSENKYIFLESFLEVPVCAIINRKKEIFVIKNLLLIWKLVPLQSVRKLKFDKLAFPCYYISVVPS